MQRRRFIKDLSASALLLLNGQTLLASQDAGWKRRKPILRFAIASDTHYGQPNTGFREMLLTGVQNINAMHAVKRLNFCVVNGDIVHDDISFLPEARRTLDTLDVKYYVTQGNHDLATATQWQTAWDMPVNFDVVKDDATLLFGTTSNETGKYLPPDMDWLTAKFKEHEKARHILLFIHIPPIKWTKHAIESTAFQELVKRQKNLRAVFHGHEHDQDGIKWQDKIPYLFDSHLGGSWGTDYRGYRMVELFRDGSIKTWIMNPSQSLYLTDIPSA
ncbi:MAG: metallophosphoesterase [Bacteroidetes bacterium]|nr:metallophosphoesterase [Bacteroidota bacterium]